MEKYVKIKKIGEGSFGKALLVKSKKDGKQMVVKEINMSKMSSKEREEARKEVSVLSQLHHPNIVSYLESFEQIGNLYIVMDYCDAGDLYGKINAQRGILFSEEQILDWLVQMSLGVKHIHDRKILHRDIKSQNIFLTRHGMVKIGDFGIAKVLGSTVELARTCIGTPYYLSPEICENRPYNNKSDIWSLGCVLYELTTLKHAFEAGNMKNLVLKIIRGSYPPPPSKYSYDLRSLISQLFRRSPRDRPSISVVLKKPLLQTRIRKFLSEPEFNEEFSHTLLHGVKIQKRLPAGGGRPLPPKPVQARKLPTPANRPQYNPASVYGPSVARKSRENRKIGEPRRSGEARKSNDVRKSAEGVRKSAEVRKSGGEVRKSVASGGARKPAAQPSQDFVKKTKELLEKAKKEELKKKDQQYAKQHRELVEKQKVNRINKAREEGWQKLVGGLGSNESDKAAASPRREESKPVPSGAPSQPPCGAPLKGNYERYHEFLNNMDAKRKVVARPQSARDSGGRVGGVAGALGARAPPLAGLDAAAQAAKKGEIAGAKGAGAANQARVKEDYAQRQREFAVNKAKAQGQVFGGGGGGAGVAAPLTPQNRPKPSEGKPVQAVSRPLSAREKKAQKEQDYLTKLRQIRLQNFNERRSIQDKIAGKADPKYKPPQVVESKNEPDIRKQKIAALRAQAEERAKKLKVELEKKRKEAYELEKKKLRDFKPVPKCTPSDKVSKAVVPPVKPAKVLPMTEAMKAIGAAKEQPKPPLPVENAVGMTAALKAIGVAQEVVRESRDDTKSPIQKKRDRILKRINANPPVENDVEKENKAQLDKPVDLDKPLSDRPKWGVGKADILSQLSLEETASKMEVTSVRDSVVKHLENSSDKMQADLPSARKQWGSPKNILMEDGSGEEEALPSARKQWGGPGNTVLKALQEASLSETDAARTAGILATAGSPECSPDVTSAGQTEEITGQAKDIPQNGGKAPAIGTTITIARNQDKGTVVIKKIQPETPSVVQNHPPLEEVDSSTNRSDAEGQTDIVVDDEDSHVSDTDEMALKSSSMEIPAPVDDLQPTSSDVEPATAADESTPDNILFSKVEGDVVGTEKKDMEVEDLEAEVAKPVEDKTKTKKRKSSGNLTLGLTTGHFDIDVKLLRTCSEPDLSKILREEAMEDSLKGTTGGSASAEILPQEPESEEKPAMKEISEEEKHDQDMDISEADKPDKEDSVEDKESEEIVEEELTIKQEQEVVKSDTNSSGDMAEEDEDEDTKKGSGSDDNLEEEDKSEEDEDGLLYDDADMDEVVPETEDNDTEPFIPDKEDSDDVDLEDEQSDVLKKLPEDKDNESGSNTDDDDMETMRQSMMSLLKNEDASDDSDEKTVKSKKKVRKVVKKTKKVKKKKKKKEDTGEEEESVGVTSESAFSGGWSYSSVADFQSMKETMRELLVTPIPSDPSIGNKAKKSPARPGALGGGGDAETTDSSSSILSARESWQSDEDNGDDDYFEEDDMFSRLEESRAKLEEELGCDTFLEAYKTVHAIHEDEDENMDEGIKLVTQILGVNKAHLYPSILQLVMADGVFTEDND